MDITSTVTLNDGVEMPWLGLGTYRLDTGKKAWRAVEWALDAGYRLFDTAKLYGNESFVGAALREGGIPRDELFITTKLWNTDHGYDSTLRACSASMRELGVDYLDLYLIHWPVADLRAESWRAMEALAADGTCRAVGVSNYTVRHLEELLAASGLVPAVNQVEFHPLLYQEELLRFCGGRGIHLQAYSPLARTRGFEEPVVKRIAGEYGRTPAQVYLRWALQHGVSVIPKSASRERIVENKGVFDFEIERDRMRALDSLDRGTHVSWDPTGEP